MENVLHPIRGIMREVKTSYRGTLMTESLHRLLIAAKKVTPSSEENEEQRRSFAYGNTKIENAQITRETVDKEAEELKRG